MRSDWVRRLLGTTASGLLVAMGTALAQEDDTESGDSAESSAEADEPEGQFLGTLTLGESKREVQTDTATPLTVIDQTEIDDRQANTVAELIDSVPGVTLVNGSTPSGSGINIRGFGANGTFGTDQKVAIIVDGATTGGEEIYRIGTQLFTDPYLYRSVEVIRGTVGSFEYGAGIVGGVVRLETKDASDFTGGEPGFNVGVTLGAFSNNEAYNGSVTTAWQPTENLELLANYSYREQENQEDGNGDIIGNSAFELPSFLLKGRYSWGDAHTMMASFTQTTTAERDVPYDTFFTTTDAFGNVDRDITSQTATAVYGYKKKKKDLVNFEVALSYANQEIDGSYVEGSSPFEDIPFFGAQIRGLANANHQFETTRLTIRNEALADTGPFAHRVRSGVEYIRRERADQQSAPGGEDDRYALFLIDVIEFADGWSVSPALRYETSSVEGTLNDGSDVSFDNDALMGGASLRYEFRNGLALFGSYAHTKLLPIIDDLENAVLMEQPETADTYELGFSYFRTGLFNDADTLAFKLNFYDTTLDDITSYSGVEEAEIQGIEVEGSFAFDMGLYADVNANFTHGSEVRSNGREVAWRNAPADNYRLTIGQRFGQFADFSYELIVNQDDTRSTLDTSDPVTHPNGLIILQETEGFANHNLRLTLTPQSTFLAGSQIRLGVENLTNEQFTPLLATRPFPGRNFKITVSRLF